MAWANLKFSNNTPGATNATAGRRRAGRRLLHASRRLLDDFEWEEEDDDFEFGTPESPEAAIDDLA